MQFKMMTIFEVYKKCVHLLADAGIDESDFEARIICEHIFAFSGQADFLLNRSNTADIRKAEAAFDFCKRRAMGTPLQYLLGAWNFMGLTFSIGEGVLIPRPETEELCSFVIEKIKSKKNPVVFDLCSGSGCIGLSIKHFVPQARVYMIEKSSEAVKFLEINKVQLGHAEDVVSVQGDITLGFEGFSFLPLPDVIVSNPPYIITKEIASLQKEVQNEPFMALDGGEDGYDFYRVLADKWLPFVNENGLIAVECGEGQADKISSMFLKFCSSFEIVNDFNSIPRVVVAYKDSDKKKG